MTQPKTKPVPNPDDVLRGMLETAPTPHKALTNKGTKKRAK